MTLPPAADARERLEKLERLYGVLVDISAAVARTSTVGELARSACDALVEVGGYGFAAVLLAEGAEVPLRLVASRGAPVVDTLATLTTTASAQLLAVVGGGEVWVSNDLAHDTRVSEASRAASRDGAHSVAMVRLERDGVLKGLLVLRAEQSGYFDEEDVRHLRQLGESLAFAIGARHRDASLALRDTQYATLFREAHDGIFIADQHGRYLDANPAGLRMLGYTLEELRTKRLFDLTTPDDPPRMVELEAQGRLVRDRKIRRKDGSLVLVEISAVRLPDGSFQSIVRDVGPRRRLESQLVLTDRLVSLGTLAAGVAHELNNPLAWIVSNLSQLKESLAALGLPNPELEELVSESLEGAHRIVSVISDLSSFTADDGTEKPVSLAPAVSRALALVKLQRPHAVQFTTALSPTPEVQGNELRLVQVFVNLLQNAAEAMPPGRAGHVWVSTATTPEGLAQVTVRDDGEGIAAADLPRIFDPFFTTRTNGTGLGLSVVFHTITQLGGTLEVDSRPGEGTVVTVTFPDAPRGVV